MREYELTYLISDNVPEADLNKVTGKVGGYVTSLGGKILKEEIWGRRKLVYPIKKQGFATYITLNFSMPAEKVNEFEHNIFMSSKIIRHLMIVQDYGQEELILTPEDVAETKEITEVIGGEKSFEAVVGETEESKDLMAVRGEESTPEDAAPDKNEVQEEEIVEDKVKEIKTEEKTETEKEKKEEVSPAAEKIEEKVEEKSSSTEKKDKKETKKPVAEKKPAKTNKKDDKSENEADRLSKLDKELDDILGDEL